MPLASYVMSRSSQFNHKKTNLFSGSQNLNDHWIRPTIFAIVFSCSSRWSQCSREEREVKVVLSYDEQSSFVRRQFLVDSLRTLSLAVGWQATPKPIRLAYSISSQFRLG